MKKLLLMAAMVCGLVYCQAQNTTETEYNYIKRGIKASEDQGLDMKAGYEFITLSDEKGNNNFRIRVGILKRKKDGSIAGTQIRLTPLPLRNQVFDFCFPAPPTKDNRSAYGGKQFGQDYDSAPQEQKELVLQSMASFFDFYLIRLNNNKLDLRAIPD